MLLHRSNSIEDSRGQANSTLTNANASDRTQHSRSMFHHNWPEQPHHEELKIANDVRTEQSLDVGSDDDCVVCHEIRFGPEMCCVADLR
jgi:hypothetical protein